MKIITTPEEAFLENSPIISPADMINCVATRTEAIIDCALAANDAGTLSKDTLAALLWQVSGNLEQIDRIAKKWHSGDVRAIESQNKAIPVSLGCAVEPSS